MSTRRKSVSVSFVGDDEVHEHIVNTSDKKRSYHGRKPRKQTGAYEDSESEEASSEVTEAPMAETGVFKPTADISMETDYSGENVFGFPSIKRKSQMQAKASQSAQALLSPKTPNQRTSLLTERTPKSILKTKRGLKVNKLRASSRIASSTPQRLYSRNKQEVDSDSDDSVSSGDSEDCESDRNATPKTPKSTPKLKSKSTPKSTPKSTTKAGLEQSPSVTPKGHANTPKALRDKGRKNKGKDNFAEIQKENVEAYFDAQTAPTVTSDRTLARLETPRMDRETLDTVLSGLEPRYKDERLALIDKYREGFTKWMFLLSSGFNLLFHGIGSKRSLLEEFRETHLSDYTHIVINGFFPSLTIKSILNNITEDVLDHRSSFRSPIEQCHFICQQYKAKDAGSLFLVIHNIDGPMLRQERAQSILSQLAQNPNIHVLASVDHINAALLWDHAKMCGFNWLWFDVTTYESYTEETCYENSLMVQQSGALALSSLTHVTQSLTPNSRGIFMLLARHHLQHCNEAGYQGLAFPLLYQKCREAFLVNTDQTLRTHLTEFKDHKLITIKKAPDGVECLTIPLDSNTLQEFIEQQEEQS